MKVPIPVPWPDVAHSLGGGIWPGLHSLVAGTGYGKSQFECQKAAHAAAHGIPVVIVSLDHDCESIVLRIASAAAGVHWSRLFTGKATEKEIRRVREAAEPYCSLPISVVQADPGAWTDDHLEVLARTVRRRHPDGPILIIVDYLQLVDDIDAVAYKARAMARELGVAIELISSAAGVSSAAQQAGLGFEGARRVVRNPDGLVGLGSEIEFASDTVTVLVRRPTELETGEQLMLHVVPKVRYGAPSWSGLAFDGGRFAEHRLTLPQDGLHQGTCTAARGYDRDKPGA